MRISVLIPAYMPDDNLIRITKDLRDNGFDVLVVDDGSGSSFASVFEEAGKYAHVLHHDKNKGKGAALKTGFANVRDIFPEAEGIITADADGQHSIKDICRVAELLSDGAGCVITERNLGKNIPARSKFGNDLSRFVYAASTGRYLYDTQSGLRGFAIDHCDWLVKVSGTKYDYEMGVLIHIDKLDLPIARLPIETIYLDNNKSSHFNPVMDTLRIYERFAKILAPSLICYLLNIITVIVMLCLFDTSWSMLVIFGAGTFFTLLSLAINKLFVFKKMSAATSLKMSVLSTLRILFSMGVCALAVIINFPVAVAFVIATLLLIPFQFLVPYLFAEMKY